MLEKNNYLNQLIFAKNKKEDYLKELDKLINNKINNIECIGRGATLSQMYYLQYMLDQYVDILTRIRKAGEAYIRESKLMNNSIDVSLEKAAQYTTIALLVKGAFGHNAEIDKLGINIEDYVMYEKPRR